jgi:hypothetical protein
MGVGGATPANTGAGITFPTVQSASTNAKTLDDYEEGTWTPVITFSGAAVGQTYSAQAGYYTKVGRVVTVSCYIAFTNKGSSTGNAVLTGLPFTNANISSNYVRCPIYINTLATPLTGNDVSYMAPNTAVVNIAQLASQATTTNLTHATFNNNSDFMVSFSYFTAT